MGGPAADRQEEARWDLSSERGARLRVTSRPGLAKRGLDVIGNGLVAAGLDDHRDLGIVPALLHGPRLADDADRGHEQDRPAEDRRDEVAAQDLDGQGESLRTIVIIARGRDGHADEQREKRPPRRAGRTAASRSRRSRGAAPT